MVMKAYLDDVVESRCQLMREARAEGRQYLFFLAASVSMIVSTTRHKLSAEQKYAMYDCFFELCAEYAKDGKDDRSD